jgi:flagellar export protein FliJ
MNYPLESVIKLRETARDEALSQLALALADLEKATRRVAELGHQVEQARQNHMDTRQRRSTSHDHAFVRMCSDYLAALEAEIDTLIGEQALAEQDRQKAELVVQDRRAQLATAEREIQAVLKHKDLWLAEQRLNRARRDEAALDDLALQQWRRRDPS